MERDMPLEAVLHMPCEYAPTAPPAPHAALPVIALLETLTTACGWRMMAPPVSYATLLEKVQFVKTAVDCDTLTAPPYMKAVLLKNTVLVATMVDDISRFTAPPVVPMLFARTTFWSTNVEDRVARIEPP